LQDELPAGVLEDGVGHLRDGHAEVLHPVVRVTRNRHPVVHCRVDADRNVVLRDDVLGMRGGTCLARSSTWILVLIMPRVSVQGLI